MLHSSASPEMIHTYSLIHDDLSAMDNDELRSGKPTNHRVFGEGMAILAGDGLLTEDCSLLSNAAYLYGQITKEIALRAIREIALSAGLHGLVAGQAQDLLSEDSEPDSETLSFIHLKRQLSSSGAVRLGGILASCSEQELTGFSECGQRIGLTFQIVGAILDVERKSEVPGNPKGSDEKGEKDDLSSSIWAGRESRKRAHDLVEEELETQEGFGDRADPLRGITLSSSKDITELLLFSFPPNSGMLEEGHTMLLQTINGPGDLKAFNTEELKALAEEVRSLIIERVSLNGGHLSSNLGVVELSIALHYVFNSPADKIVWDVGHQSYAHKLLTGRHRQFKTLRTHGGISGFPRITESPHDAFGTGHSSTSISAALGIIEARDKKKEFFKVIAVIGDGALTGGLAFEGLNHAGHLKKDLIVILNDNEMSISPNVGALSNYLSRVLTGTFFKKFKKETRAILEGIPRIGESVARIAERAEDSLKGFFLPGGLFMDLGFNYIGPIDGHDITLLIETLDRLRGTSGPTLVHLVTKKGKGYTFSEDDPCVFHGIGPFTVETGLPNGEKSRPQLKGSTRLEEPWTSYCDAFGQALVEIADGDRRVVAITAAMKEGTGLADYAKAFPERFYDVGIAEPHAVTFAAGLAAGGLKPVVTVYSTFLQRAYDQIVHDVCLQKLPVVFAVDRAGIVGEDGATHQGLFDVSLLRTVPNLVLMAPKDTDELKAMLRFAISYNGPAALRYPRGKMRRDSGSTGTPPVIELGKAELIREGDDLAILALGDTVYRALIAAERLEDQGIRVSVVNPRFVKPLDDVLILSLAQRCRRIVTIEENILAGGFGTAVLECLSTAGLTDVIVKRIGIDDVYVEHGSQVTLRKKYGLDEETITKVMFALLEESPCRPAF